MDEHEMIESLHSNPFCRRSFIKKQRIVCLMSVEKRMLHELKTSDNFMNKLATDEFTKTDSRIHFIHIKGRKCAYF